MATLLLCCALSAGPVSCTELTVLDQRDPLHPLPIGNLAHRWGQFDLSGSTPNGKPELIGNTEIIADALRLEAAIPPLVADCEEAYPATLSTCADADHDGLSDLWERIALHRLRPFLRMHPDEPMFTDHHARIVANGRVMPASDGRIRVLLALVFSNDYGRCSATRHRGDPERVALDLALSDTRTVEIVGVYAASHEGTGLDGSRLLTGEALRDLEYTRDARTGMPRWIVYSSIGKHAMYASTEACAGQGSVACTTDDCASRDDARNDLLPDVYNVGEPDSPEFVFEGSDSRGLFRDPTPPLRRDQVWGPEKYCGDIPEEALGSYSASCAGPIRDKLLDDPFL